MKFAHLSLGSTYLYKIPERPKKAPLSLVKTLAFKSALRKSKEGKNVAGHIFALVQFENETEQWVLTASLKEIWSTEEDKWESLDLAAPEAPSLKSASYWRSTRKVYLDTASLDFYCGEDSELRCANPSEAWIIQWLNKKEIHFDYEPTEFSNTEKTKGFRPDLYFPEHDLYLELSSSPRKHSSKKRKKLRLMEKYHPDIQATVIYWEDMLFLAENNLSKEDFIAYLLERIKTRRLNTQTKALV